MAALIDFGIAARPLPGQNESGDLHLVSPFPNGVLVAAMDGLGHGEAAAAAARIAAATLETHAEEALIPLMQRCHEALKGTRGVVMSLASFNMLAGTMTWLGVGNVEGVLLRASSPGRAEIPRQAREALLLRGGVVGYQLPPLHASSISVMPGDLLIFATDGVRSGFAEELRLRGPAFRQAPETPQQIADHILARFGKDTDDALVLVARYLGPAHER